MSEKKQKAPRLTAEQKTEIEAQINSGKTVSEISKEMVLANATVARYARLLKVDMEKKSTESAPGIATAQSEDDLVQAAFERIKVQIKEIKELLGVLPKKLEKLEQKEKQLSEYLNLTK